MNEPAPVATATGEPATVAEHATAARERDPRVRATHRRVLIAIALLCVLLGAIGFTIYPGSSQAGRMYEQIRALAEEAKQVGLAVVVWSYPRGSSLSKAGETAIDVIAYAAQIAAQLGAHIIKVKLPTDHIEQEEARKVYEKQAIPIGTLTERVRHVVLSSFDGRRILIFSGGAKKDNDDDVIAEARAIRDGGGFGSIIGRNSFQRKKPEAIRLLHRIMSVYSGEIP